ncbi:MAG: Endolytic murein transglycosylase [Parcubacteria group bacterium]|nr:Endolytic murein transglycosylase [Parcubacteria group bacterium]
MTVRERAHSMFVSVRFWLTEQKLRTRALKGKWRYVVAAIVLVLLIPIYILFTPAVGFPKGQIISIPADSASDQIASQLAAQHVIRSAFQFKVLARLTGQDRQLESGMYVFKQSLGLVSVMNRLATGNHGIAEARVTLTEGMTAKDMAQVIAAQLPGFDTTGFLNAASTSEGYLFPDTYFILPGTTPEDIVQRLHTQFDAKVATIQPQITKFGKPLRDDVIIASILEREVKGTKDERIVAGILYNRLNKGMPLQVDAAFGYAHDIDGYTPTSADLTGNSPYNTYRFSGLPPTPISNPGLDSLLAAVTPTKTSYIYYITGTDGTMHYATTFAQHEANIAKYLK